MSSWHPILSEIQQTEKDRFVAKVSYSQKFINLEIDLDGEPYEKVIRLAIRVYNDLGNYDEMSKNVISKDLLDTYNESWREYDEMQSNGNYKPITKPVLSSEEFKSKFKLESLKILGDSIEFNYGESDLFAGHSIYVNSFDGLKFEDTNAEMFG